MANTGEAPPNKKTTPSIFQQIDAEFLGNRGAIIRPFCVFPHLFIHMARALHGITFSGVVAWVAHLPGCGNVLALYMHMSSLALCSSVLLYEDVNGSPPPKKGGFSIES